MSKKTFKTDTPTIQTQVSRKRIKYNLPKEYKMVAAGFLDKAVRKHYIRSMIEALHAEHEFKTKRRQTREKIED